MGLRLASVRSFPYAGLGLMVLTWAAAWLGIGCSRPIDSASTGSLPAVTVEYTISPEPPQVGPATITLILADAGGKPVSGARINLEADMSHAGMAPLSEVANETAPGHYQSHLRFSMAGDWVILLHLRLPGGQTLERQFNVNGVRPE